MLNNFSSEHPVYLTKTYYMAYSLISGVSSSFSKYVLSKLHYYFSATQYNEALKHLLNKLLIHYKITLT